MRKYWIYHLQIIFEEYRGHIPLSPFLKQYFRKHKNLGSEDRRALTTLAYAFFRWADANLKHDFESLQSLAPVWIYLFGSHLKCYPGICTFQAWPPEASLNDKMQHISVAYPRPKCDFAYASIPLSEIAEKQGFWSDLLLHQPKVFLRFPDHGQLIKAIRRLDSVPFERLKSHAHALAVEAGTDTEAYLQGLSYRVQDAASQQVAAFFPNNDFIKHIWDVCAGAGGKTLLLAEHYPQAKILATDVRSTILKNLEQRLPENFKNKVKTHTLPEFWQTADVPQKMFDLVVCDVPCTGSGTWGRTPEAAWYFNEAFLNRCIERQSHIAGQVLPTMRPGHYLIWVTCSVFACENEDAVARLVRLSGGKLHLLRKGILHVDSPRSDYLFAALLQMQE